ncbi:MAG: FKBP-type peptidyl-prolyl cis-trans isomerase, partial [Planctomycetota bacterium]|nr:FKBP-type peptidyl-prolyl cis-trans isomerase [Planctomycetota bacterium]
MQIIENAVASIQYTLKNGEGEVLDQSPPGQPMPYLHGAQNIIPGLEVRLEGKSAGDKVEAV